MRRLLQSLLGLLSDVRKLARHARPQPPREQGGEREPTRHEPRLPKKPPYDLANDTSTDNQKYLM